MDKPLISIIVITYNSQNTIIETLKSISEQTYNNIEIVVSDDCSDDNTLQVVNKWICESGNKFTVRVIEAERNTGIAANCNRGVMGAKGEFVKLLAGDDCLFSEAVEEFYKAMLLYGNDVIVQSRVRIIDENGDINETLESDFDYTKINLKILSDTNVNQYRELLKSNFIIAPAVGLIRRSLFDELGLFDERFPMMEDYPFYVKLLAKGIKIRLLNKALVKYRVSANSISNKRSVRYLTSYNDFIIKVVCPALKKEKMYFCALKKRLRCIARKIKYKL